VAILFRPNTGRVNFANLTIMLQAGMLLAHFLPQPFVPFGMSNSGLSPSFPFLFRSRFRLLSFGLESLQTVPLPAFGQELFVF
jgi:hypothetical protein